MRLEADIHKRTGGFELDVQIASDASRIGILGASGSGKSMTLRSIAGIEDPDSGRIEAGGRLLYDSAAKICLRPQKRRVGYMFQNYALFPTMTVLQNVMAGLRGSREENRAKASDMLSRFRMEGHENSLPGELSGGQQQRVALARIMVTGPDIILLDEPFSALDGYLRDRMQVEMLELLEAYPGQVIMVSHSRDELYRFSEELFVLADGRILSHGSPRGLFRDPGSVEAAKLTGCKNFSAAVVKDAHTVEAADWGITLSFEGEVPPDTRYLGYRAHSFEPVWGGPEETCLRAEVVRTDELPFETNYYIRTPSGRDPLCWFVQGEEQKTIDKKGMPDYLKMTEHSILFLK